MSQKKRGTAVRTILEVGQFKVEKKGEQKLKVRHVDGRNFTMTQVHPGKWTVSGKNYNGSWTRAAVIIAVNLEDAVNDAAVRLYGGLSDGVHADPRLSMAEALCRAIEAQSTSQANKDDHVRYAGYFLTWWSSKGRFKSKVVCDSESAARWRVLQPQDIRNYITQMKSKGLTAAGKLSQNTRSHYLEPIRLASKYMAENWPDFYRNICANIKDSAHGDWDVLYNDDDGNPCLSFQELFSFLEYLQTHELKDVLLPGVMLQGICALQLQEALRLRWTDVDFETGTIVVQGHLNEFGDVIDRPKNPFRVRKLKVPKLMLSYFKGVQRTHLKVVPYDYNYNAYGLLVSRALKLWDVDLALPPKDLRNTLTTHAQDHTHDDFWNLKIVDRWMGHAPKGIRERHYYSDRKGRMAKLMAQHITPKLDTLCDKYGSNLQFFEVDASESQSIKSAKILDIA